MANPANPIGTRETAPKWLPLELLTQGKFELKSQHVLRAQEEAYRLWKLGFTFEKIARTLNYSENHVSRLIRQYYQRIKGYEKLRSLRERTK